MTTMFTLTKVRNESGQYYIGLRFNPSHAEYVLGRGNSLDLALCDLREQVLRDLDTLFDKTKKKEEYILSLDIKEEDFFHLQKGIKSLVLKDLNTLMELTTQYELGMFPGSEKVTNLNRKFCFDLFFECARRDPVFEQFKKRLYLYLDDEQVYRALSLIIPSVEKNY